MNIDLSHLTRLQADKLAAESDLEKAKRNLEFLRLQVRDTKAALKRAKSSELIKLFVKKHPTDYVEVTPGAGCVYVSITFDNRLQASLYSDVPAELGLKIHEQRQVTDQLGSPTLTVYRTPHEPGVLFYVTTPNR